MARSNQTTVDNNFSKGLITEATPMSFPENAVTDCENVVFDVTGKVSRRLGLDYEVNKTILLRSDITANIGAITSFVWETVSNNASITFNVQQIANILTFFEVNPTLGLSSTIKLFTVNLSTYKVAAWSGADVTNNPCSMISGKGRLFVTHPYCEPIQVIYDDLTDTITVSTITLLIRDVEGVEDNLSTDERPATLSTAHKYNLYNQGWSAVQKETGGTFPIMLDYWDASFADFPSNADVFWLFRDSSGLINNNSVFTSYIGNSKAPRGHYIYNAFNLDRSSNVAGATNYTTNSRPSSVAFFAGRAFFAGVSSDKYASTIFFSSLNSLNEQVGICHSLNDPTSEESFDILATDGGTIQINDAGKILEMRVSGSHLLVFAVNGTWAISGTDNGSFTATNFTVNKITGVGSLSNLPTVSVEGVPVWWSSEGIFTVKTNDASATTLSPVSLTETTIQKFYNTIPLLSKTYAQGQYNAVTKQVIWVYRSVAPTTVNQRYQYDRMLVLDRRTGSFSVYNIGTSAPFVSDITVVNSTSVSGIVQSTFKFFSTGAFGTAGVAACTYSELNQTNLRDWYSYNNVGVTVPAFFITGYRVRGELLKKFQANYLMVLTENITNGSCLVQGIWDYNRMTTSQEVCKDNANLFWRAKLKIRGNGYSLQFKFKSNADKPFTVMGWSTFETGNNVP